jgi:hypothetical protein
MRVPAFAVHALGLPCSLPDVKRDDISMLGPVLNVHGAAADFTVLNVGLLPNRRIQKHGDLLPTIRTRKRALL